MTLYEMTAQVFDLYSLLLSGEIDDAVFNDTLEAIGTEDKLVSYCQVIKQLQADAAMLKDEIDRLTAKKKACENSVTRMRDTLAFFLSSTGREKAKAGSFSVSLTSSCSVNVCDESLIPEEYTIPQPSKIDKAYIRQALLSGELVPGAELVTKESVTIR